MLSNNEIKYTSEYLAAAPSTEKTYNSQLSVSKDGNLLAYCVGNVVIVRCSKNEFKSNTVVFTGHKCKTSAVDIAPNGVFAASADIEGNVKIWFLEDGWPKFSHTVLSSKVLGISWSEKSDRILVYGMAGKQGFARYVSWDTSNNMGEITGMSKNVISGDVKKTRPYFVVVSSEDLTIRVYKGTSPVIKYTNKDHKRYVCCVKFSPLGDKFAAVGLDKRVVIYETETGNLIKCWEKEDSIQHSGGIIGVQWLDEFNIATCSLDKTVKVWNIENNKNITLYPDEKDKYDNEMYVQCGIISTKEYLISLNLNGSLNVWKIKSFLENGKDCDYNKLSMTPDFVVNGHQNSITNLLYNYTNKQIYSSDSSGKIIVWNQDKTSYIISLFLNDIKSMCFNSNEDILNAVSVDGKILSYNVNTKQILTDFTIKEAPCSICMKNDNKTIIVLFEKLLVLFGSSGNVIKDIKFKDTCQSMAYNRYTNDIYIGNTMNSDILVLNADSLETKINLNFHSTFGKYSNSTISVSHSGDYVASSDTNKHIILWSAKDFSVIAENFHFHTSRVYSLSFNKNDSLLVSTSLDNEAMVWDIKQKKRIKTFPVIDYRIGICSTFINNEGDKFVVGGSSCSPRIIPVDQ